MIKKVLIMLQNAWSPIYAGEIWPRESWLNALHKSRSGQRLKTLVDNLKDVEVWFDNATPQVSEHPDIQLPVDIEHISSLLTIFKPDIAVAAGKQAAEALLSIVKVPLLIMPHPASRVVTNKLIKQAAHLIMNGLDSDVVELKQLRNKVLKTVIEKYSFCAGGG